MFFLNTINFSLENLSKTKQPIENIFINFSQFGDPLQCIPIYTISDGIRSLVLNKLTDYNWQILHSEYAGKQVKFSEDDYPFLREIRDALKTLDSEFDIKLEKKELKITESIVEDSHFRKI